MERAVAIQRIPAYIQVQRLADEGGMQLGNGISELAKKRAAGFDGWRRGGRRSIKPKGLQSDGSGLLRWEEGTKDQGQSDLSL